MEKVEVAYVTTKIERGTGFLTIGTCFEGAVLSEEQAQQLLNNLLQQVWGELSEIRVATREGHSFAWVATNQTLCRETINPMVKTFGRTLKATGLAESFIVCPLK